MCCSELKVKCMIPFICVNLSSMVHRPKDSIERRNAHEKS